MKGAGFITFPAMKTSHLAGPLASAPVSSPQGIPVRLTGDWQIAIGPGAIQFGRRGVSIAQPVLLTVTPPETVVVTGEVHEDLPVFNPERRWHKGTYLYRVRTQECSSTGLVIERSVVVKQTTGVPLVRGTDYEYDPLWGAVGRLDGGALAAGQRVLVDYAYVPLRVDSIVALPNNTLRLVCGVPGVGALLPPDLPKGAFAIINLWHHGPADRLDDSHLYPIDPAAMAKVKASPVAQHLLPRTLAKLRAGGDVRMVAWGDSVTAGGGVDGYPDHAPFHPAGLDGDADGEVR